MKVLNKNLSYLEVQKKLVQRKICSVQESHAELGVKAVGKTEYQTKVEEGQKLLAKAEEVLKASFPLQAEAMVNIRAGQSTPEFEEKLRMAGALLEGQKELLYSYHTTVKALLKDI